MSGALLGVVDRKSSKSSTAPEWSSARGVAAVETVSVIFPMLIATLAVYAMAQYFYYSVKLIRLTSVAAVELRALASTSAAVSKFDPGSAAIDKLAFNANGVPSPKQPQWYIDADSGFNLFLSSRDRALFNRFLGIAQHIVPFAALPPNADSASQNTFAPADGVALGIEPRIDNVAGDTVLSMRTEVPLLSTLLKIFLGPTHAVIKERATIFESELASSGVVSIATAALDFSLMVPEFVSDAALADIGVGDDATVTLTLGGG